MAARLKTALAGVGAAALAGGALMLAAGPERTQAACVAVGLCKRPDMAAAMLAAIRQEQALLVFSARLVAPITSTRHTLLAGLVVDTDSQTSIVPATLGYRLDLSTLGPDDLAWDSDAQLLTVRRPALRLSAPTIHWNEAQTFAAEGWMPLNDDVALRLQQDNAGKAPGLFLQQARSPTLLAEANRAADRALAATLRLPLAAAGFPEARVVVKSR